MAEGKIERTQNSIVTTIKDGEKEGKIIQKNENGKAFINIESYGNGKLYFQDENNCYRIGE